jgi:transcription termination factor Rho
MRRKIERSGGLGSRVIGKVPGRITGPAMDDVIDEESKETGKSSCHLFPSVVDIP